MLVSMSIEYKHLLLSMRLKYKLFLSFIWINYLMLHAYTHSIYFTFVYILKFLTVTTCWRLREYHLNFTFVRSDFKIQNKFGWRIWRICNQWRFGWGNIFSNSFTSAYVPIQNFIIAIIFSDSYFKVLLTVLWSIFISSAFLFGIQVLLCIKEKFASSA